MWPEHLGGMFFQKLNQLTVWVSEITVHSCPGGTDFYAYRIEVLFQSVITQGTFTGYLFFRMNKPASIRTGLNTIAATDTIFFINQYNPFRTVEGSSYRAHLNAWRLGTVVAHLGDKI